ncbi:MAG: T9SS type A sorting domain-containing protein [Bacteroidota bacterium]
MKKQSFKQLKTTAVADKDNRNGNKNYYFMKTLKLLPFVFLLFLAQLKVYAQGDYLTFRLSGELNNIAYCQTVYNGELYVGGRFTTAGGVSASNIAKWNGTAWSALGSGITGSNTGSNSQVKSMAVYNGELYVGGDFTTAGGVSANYIAKWNGTTWSAVGSGTNNWVSSMAVYNGVLYVGGNFSAGGVNTSDIVKWNGTAWSAVGSLTQGEVRSMVVYNGELYVGGFIYTAGGVSVNHIAKWNDTTWSTVGSGTNNYVNSMVVYNGGLYVGGTFTTAGGMSANRIAKWNGTAWSAVGSGITGTNGVANSMVVYNEGLFVGGLFTTAGGVSANNIAKWNGTAWLAVGSGTFGVVNSMAVFNGELFFGGGFNIAFGVTANYIVKIRQMKEPNIAASNIQINNVTANGLTLSWTNGNGKKHLVVAKAGSAVNQVPIDTQAYTANASFSTGSNLGNANYVVYNGTGNTVNVTNLNAETVYHFAIFELNDSTISKYENYLTSTYPITNRTTLATEPTTNTSNISFNQKTINSMRVSFAAGNGSKRIVIARQGNAVNISPSDTIDYAANSNFGTTGTDLGNGNFAVYNGSGNTFNLSGLTANTIYYFKSFEYNGSTQLALNYLLSSPASSYQSTLTTEPTSSSTNIQFTNVKDSSMTLSWTVGNGQRRLLVAATSAITTFPTDGVDHLANDTFSKGDNLGFENYVVFSGTSNTFNLKGLIPNTTYHFAIFEFSGTNTSNNYLLTNPAIGSKSTLIAEPTTAASNLTLSPITNGITTVNWTNGNGDNRIVIVRQGAPINILPEDGKSYTANAVYGSGQDLGQGNFICYIGNSNTFNLQGLDPSNLYYIGVVEYNGSGGGSNYKVNLFPIADNLPTEPTTLASNMSFTNLTANSVKVNWTNGNGAYRILVAKEASVVTKKPVDGTVYVANNAFGSGADLGLANFVVYNGVANSATVTNLNNNSKYHFSLFEFNKDASGPANYANNSLNGSVDIGNPQGVEDVLENNKISVFPNPTSGIITLSSNQTIATIDVFDVTGKLVYSQQNNGKQTNIEIDLSALSNGIYFINAQTENGGISNNKVVISK